MKYLPLLWASLRRKRVRTVLTFASVVVAFLLFGVLEAVQYALTGGAELAGQDRLVTQHKISIIQPFPLSYLDRIRSVDGVAAATSQTWFGGVYQDDRNQLNVIVTHADSFVDVYAEYLTPQQKAAWLADRTGAIVGSDIAERWHWGIGDVVPMMSNIYVKRGGGNTWDLKISAIYHVDSGDNSSVYFHYDYLNEDRNFGRDEIGWAVFRVADTSRSEDIARRIDAMFANSSAETRTTTESAFLQGFANQMGNIAAIVTIVAAAVFFTMLLVTANAMAQSVRERVRDIAVLRTLGFSNSAVVLLVLAEGVVITALGAALGLYLGSGVTRGIGAQVQTFLPLMSIPPQTFVTGGALALALGALSCALPCTQIWRLSVVEQLRRT
ncbi:MAG TPA: FtsX-like permease family protein [Gammaproteobacteria bacterium]|nr:FtsX-like permease family protein [Gammaproteobacteria bacterium]